jgi:hypothetical protein
MVKPSQIKKELIAPCGMNCALCLAFQRTKKNCPGCRLIVNTEYVSIKRCVIKNCELLKSAKSGFCYECTQFPCRRMKQLDKRYRTKYSMSMLDNLEYIKTHGMRSFISNEKKRWQCSKCGSLVSVHRKDCLACGTPFTLSK